MHELDNVWMLMEEIWNGNEVRSLEEMDMSVQIRLRTLGWESGSCGQTEADSR